MSTIVTLPELDTPEAFATKYLVDKIGYNVRPGSFIYDEEINSYIFDCTAIISNYLTNIDGEGKKFVYTFNNLDKLVFEKNKTGYHVTIRPKKSDINRNIYERYINLTKEIEKELLIAGSNSWGKLTLVSHFLSPLYSMITNLIDKSHLSFTNINTGQNEKFFKLLMKEGYVDVESEAEDMFVISNKLTKLTESIYNEQEISSILEVTESVVGILFGKYYDTIKYVFGIRPPSSYVDYTKAYYFDALRYGDLIKVTENDFIDSLSNFEIYINDRLNFRRSLIELADTELFQKSEDCFIGESKIYSDLSTLRSGIMEGALIA